MVNLPPQNGQDLVIEGIAKLTCFSGLAGEFNTLVKGKSRTSRRDIALEMPTKPNWFLGGAKHPILAQLAQYAKLGFFDVKY